MFWKSNANCGFSQCNAPSLFCCWRYALSDMSAKRTPTLTRFICYFYGIYVMFGSVALPYRVRVARLAVNVRMGHARASRFVFSDVWLLDWRREVRISSSSLWNGTPHHTRPLHVAGICRARGVVNRIVRGRGDPFAFYSIANVHAEAAEAEHAQKEC